VPYFPRRAAARAPSRRAFFTPARRLALAAVCAVAALAAAAPASAQALDALLGRSAADQALDLDVTIGLDRMRSPEGWTPIRVILTSSDAVSGLLSIDTSGPAAPPVRVQAPFTTTPGRATPVDLAVPIGGFVPRLRIRAFDAQGRVLRTLNYGPNDGERALPDVFPGSGLVIAAVGRSSVMGANVRSEDEAQASAGTSPDAEMLLSATVLDIEPEALPTLWKGYDGIDVVVIDASVMERVSTQAIEAILTWTRAGGRLVLVADRPSANLARWLDAPLPAFDDPAVAPDSDALVRPITIAPSMRAQGWTTRSMEDTPYMAEGPLAMGWMAILSADPSGLFPNSPARADWARVLDPALASELAAMPEDPWRGRHMDSEVSGALDALADDLAVPNPPVFLILGLLALLAAALGPVDFYVLKALSRRQRSWMSALAWIALFTAVAYALPFWMRPSQTSFRRLAIVDARAGEPVAWRTGVTGVLLGDPGALPLQGFAPGTWARPTVGGDFAQSFFESPTLLPLDRSAAGGAAPPFISGRVWTFQTLIEDGPAPNPWSASVERTNADDDALRVTLEGPHDHAPRRLMVRTSLGDFAVSIRKEKPTRWIGQAVLDQEPESRTHSTPAHGFWSSRFDQSAERRRNDAAAQSLPAAIARGRTFETLLATGEWAVLCFTIEDHPPDVAPPPPSDRAQTTLYRILVPITVAGAPDP